MIQDILNEVEKATKKFPTWPDDMIHAAGNVQEEAGELVKVCNEIVYEFPKSTIIDARKEAIQTAAMCFRFIVSLDNQDYHLKKSSQHVQKNSCAACDRGDYQLGHSELCRRKND